ncbi:hypothetical protein AAFJ72_15780 [Brevibacillus gelatini]|uniref:hypothetical protein n=1 Tax=Brevibacillus gelatini TaxID=1655277 RepID=UPI003D81ABCF
MKKSSDTGILIDSSAALADGTCGNTSEKTSSNENSRASSRFISSCSFLPSQLMRFFSFLCRRHRNGKKILTKVAPEKTLLKLVLFSLFVETFAAPASISHEKTAVSPGMPEP